MTLNIGLKSYKQIYVYYREKKLNYWFERLT